MKWYAHLLVMFLLVFFRISYAQERAVGQDNIQVNFEVGDDKIYIHYFLKGDSEKEYKIKAVLRKNSDSNFELIPSQTTGDVGKGKFANKNATIVWTMNKQEEDMLTGEDFYFEIIAEEIQEASSWYWYLLGAAVLGGGAATYLLLSKDKKDNTTTTAENIASPPGRP